MIFYRSLQDDGLTFPSVQVVDEADRLLTQSFHDWLPTVLSALKPTFSAAALREDETLPKSRQTKSLSRATKTPTVVADALAPSWWDADGGDARMSLDLDEPCLGSVSAAWSEPCTESSGLTTLYVNSVKSFCSPPRCLETRPRLTRFIFIDRSIFRSRTRSIRTRKTKVSTPK